MTIKQKKAIQNVVANGGNVTQAMLEAGYSPNTANTPSKLTSSPEVATELERLLFSKGINLDKALQPIADALTATTVHIVGNGEEAMAEVVIDHKTRLAASDRALKLLHIVKPDKEPDNLKELHDAIKDGMDEVELTRAVFRKDAPKVIMSE